MKKHLVLKTLAAVAVLFFAHSTAQAQYNYFNLYFDENGHASVQTTYSGNYTEGYLVQVDPNTGLNALTYQLPSFVGSGIVDILDPSGALSDALSFYNGDTTGYMAYYSLPGTDLADTISGGYVPLGYVGATEVGDSFAYLIGNNYYGVSGGSVPDGGTTATLLGIAIAGLAAVRRKLS